MERPRTVRPTKFVVAPVRCMRALRGCRPVASRGSIRHGSLFGADNPAKYGAGARFGPPQCPCCQEFRQNGEQLRSQVFAGCMPTLERRPRRSRPRSLARLGACQTSCHEGASLRFSHPRTARRQLPARARRAMPARCRYGKSFPGSAPFWQESAAIEQPEGLLPLFLRLRRSREPPLVDLRIHLRRRDLHLFQPGAELEVDPERDH